MPFQLLGDPKHPMYLFFIILLLVFQTQMLQATDTTKLNKEKETFFLQKFLNDYEGKSSKVFEEMNYVEELNDSIKGRRAPWDADYGWMDFRKRLFQDKDNEQY